MIVLEILKIIGIVLACLVGLVIVLLLLVLLVPLRYKIHAAGENSQIEAEACLSWLLGLFRATASYREQKLSYAVRLAGASLWKGTVGEDEVEVLKAALSEEETASDEKKSAQIAREIEKAEAKAERAEQLKAEKAAEKEQKKEEKKQEKQEEKARRKEAEKDRSFRERVEALRSRLASMREKYEKIRKIVTSRITKRALHHLKVELFRLLNHIKPRRLSGVIDFGLEDPADTAVIYGNAAPLLEAAGKGRLTVIPEFYEKVVRLDLLIKGRFFIGYMVLCVSRLYLDRDIQKLIRVTRRFLNGG